MKNKAFTLIELLAVIVILAIITLIAVPIVLNIIDNTKDSSVIRSTELYLDAVEQAIARKNLTSSFNPNTCTVKNDGNLNCDIGELIIDIKGQKPCNGEITFKNGKIIKNTLDFCNGENEVQEEYKDETGANVEIIQGLTPVIYDGSNWKVADIYSKWYDYNNQEWANAVILNSGVTKSVGQTVDVSSEVKAMFVYIPRYEYKIEGTYGKGGSSATSPGEIEINFIDKTKTTVSSGYRVHPAFTFGTEQLSGIWVGKFETSASKSSACHTSASEANCDNTNQDPYIIPNVNSLRYQKVSNQFATAQKFNSYITNGDSHMMKNSEWGAVAYLSQSKYGKYGNSKYSGAKKEVRINNCLNYITGIGANSQNESSSTSTCTTNTYTTANGQAASTTGNVSGIYDMSGGANEYVMGYLSGVSETWGANDLNNYAGFASAPNAKYYDSYTSTNTSSSDKELSKTACSGGVCYGHALSETTGWYGDDAVFVHSGRPWFSRGAHCNSTSFAGVFAFYYNGAGDARSHNSFRVVVSQTTN